MSSPVDAGAAPAAGGVEVPVAQAHALFTSFSSFLTVAIHTILFYRNIYPPQTFLSARAYNLPVHQSRHPKVCSWIRDAVDAVLAQIAAGNVARVAVVIHAPLAPAGPPSKSPSPPSRLPPGSVLERWMFDVGGFPAWPGGADGMRSWNGAGGQKRRDDAEDPEAGEDEGATGAGAGDAPEDGVNWADVDEQLRGAVQRIAHTGERLEDLPEGCTFTVAVELREDGKAPIGHPQPWIPSQRNLQPASQSQPERGRDVGGEKTTPIRSVGAGPLFFECWLEEGKAKQALRSTQGSKGEQPS